jgi:hypothetical protein
MGPDGIILCVLQHGLQYSTFPSAVCLQSGAGMYFENLDIGHTDVNMSARLLCSHMGITSS